MTLYNGKNMSQYDDDEFNSIVSGIGSSRTGLDLEDTSRTKFCGLGLGLGLKDLWPWRWPRRPLALALKTPGLGLGLDHVVLEHISDLCVCKMLMCTVWPYRSFVRLFQRIKFCTATSTLTGSDHNSHESAYTTAC